MSNQTETATGNCAVHNNDNSVRPEAPEPNPQVYVPGSGSTYMEAAKNLYQVEAASGSLYRTGREVSVIDREAGRAEIATISPAAAMSRFERNVQWVKPSKDGPVPTVLTDKVAAALLAAEERKLLPCLYTIVEYPFLVVRDNELVSLAPGFNRIEGIYVASQRAVETMSVGEAVKLLRDELFGEFSFLRPSDRSRAIAALLTPALSVGRLIKGFIAPTAFEATASQTGKGMMVRCIEAANGELGTYISKRKGGVGSLDESIDGALIAGRPILVLDNLRGPLNSEALESLLTKDHHQARTPYRTYVNIDTTRFCLFITSNGADFTPDMANRVSVVRLRKREGYNYRCYPEGLIDRHAAAHVPRYLGAIHAVVKAWFAAGRPQTSETRHTFLAWSQSLDWVVQNIFGCAPLMEDHESIRDRLSRPGLGFVRQMAAVVEKVKRLGEDLQAHDLFNLAEEHQAVLPGDPRTALDDDERGARFVGRVMGRAFGESDRIELEEYRVVREQIEANEIVHHPTRIYRFTRVAEMLSPASAMKDGEVSLTE